jgi:uncharacterized protein (DUF58 family)
VSELEAEPEMPTSRGAAAMAAVVVLYTCGWLLGYPELCVLGAGTMLALFAGAACVTPFVRIRVRREIAPARIARGGAAIAVLHVTNTGRRASRAFTATDRCGGRTLPVSVPRLGAGATRASSYRLATLHRGEVPVGPLTLTRGDPFGFYRRAVDYGEGGVLVVRPRTVPLAVLASGHAASLDGPDADTAPSGTTTFDSLREYSSGDDLRHIHWRTSARAGRLMVRRLVDSSEPRTTVLLDACRDSYPGDDFETAVDIAASVAVAAARAGFPVSVLAGGDRLLADRGGSAGSEAVLDLLALVQPGTSSLADALDRLPRGRRSGVLVVITGTAEPTALERVAAAASRYERTVTVRAGARLPPLPEPFALRVIDAGTVDEFAAAWNRAGPR